MSVDITPPLLAGAKVVDSYGPNRFKISEEAYEGSVIILPDRVIPWDMTNVSDLTAESFDPLFEADANIEVLILGCGEKMTLIPAKLRQALRDKGTPPDFMETGAACRTYNILLGEGRRVAAALIALPSED